MQEGGEQLAVRGTVGFLLWQCQRDIKPLHQALVLLLGCFLVWWAGRGEERQAKRSYGLRSAALAPPSSIKLTLCLQP